MQSVLQNAQSVVLWTDELSPDVRSLVSCRSVLSNMQQCPAECSVGPSSLNNRTEPPLCACRVNIRDLPVREYLVTANYPIEIRAGSDVGHTPHNGATRQIPNTQHLSTPSDGNTIPSGDSRPLAHEDFLAGLLRCHTGGALCVVAEEEEPLWMKMSVTCSCPAGSVLLRDNRAW